jgi:alanyl-tRNA synthetase
MWQIYPELRERAGLISQLVATEEERFVRTMARGESAIEEIHEAANYYREVFARAPLGIVAARQRVLSDMFHSSELPEAVKVELLKPYDRRLGVNWWEGDADKIRATAQIPMKVTGGVQFILWDTYGYPKELTREVAARYGLETDEKADQEFDRLMEEQRERARAAGRFRLSEGESAEAYAALSHLQPRFTGYDTLSQQTGVAGIIAGGAAVDSIGAGDEAEIVFFETPFYAEQGGQVGDTGEIIGPNGRFRVEDTQRTEGGLILHRGRVVEGRIAVNDDVLAQVDAARRWDIMRNHTATHLLHAALRRVVGPHARQAGSLVAPERLRFDFTHVEALKPQELAEVQRLVNEKIRENLPVATQRKSYEEATAGGATALFDEKYAAEVRVVEVAEADERYSAELCGGTHVHATGDIGQFIIVGEESIGAGLRRIEALTGRGADEYVRDRLTTLQQLRGRLAVTGDDAELVSRVDSLFEEVDSLKKRVQTLEREVGRNRAESLLAEAEHVDGRSLLTARLPASSPEALREMGDWLRERLGSGVIVLGTIVDGRPNLLAMVTPDLTSRGLHAGELVKQAAQVTGGGGGGRPEMAQAGGRDASRLDEALRVAKDLATAKIKAMKES